MKGIVLAVLMALGAAAPAMAQSSYDWRYRNEIHIQDHGRDFTFDRRDRVFQRLLSSPFNFRPGLNFVYTDNCRRHECEVLAYNRYTRSPVARLWAPHIWDVWGDDRDHWGDDRHRGDRGYDDRGYGDHDSDHWDDDHPH